MRQRLESIVGVCLALSIGYSVYTSWQTGHRQTVTCHERQRNTLNATHRGDVIRDDLVRVDAPFLRGAASIRTRTAIIEDRRGRKAEAVLNREAATEWYRLARVADALAESIKPFETPTC